jgi:ribonuclease Z
MYVASRGLLKMKKPTVIVPRCVKETVEKLFLIQRELDGSDLPVNLIGLDVSYSFPAPLHVAHPT